MSSADGGLGRGRGCGARVGCSWSGNSRSGGQLGRAGAGVPEWTGYFGGAAPSFGNAMAPGAWAGGLGLPRDGSRLMGNSAPLGSAPTAIVFGSRVHGLRSVRVRDHWAPCPHRTISSEVHRGNRIHHEAYEIHVSGPSVVGAGLMTPSVSSHAPLLGSYSSSSQRGDIGLDLRLRAPLTQQRYRSPVPELSTHSQSSPSPMCITGSYSLASPRSPVTFEDYSGVRDLSSGAGLLVPIGGSGQQRDPSQETMFVSGYDENDDDITRPPPPQ